MSLDNCSLVRSRFNIEKAVKAQKMLSKRVSLEDGIDRIETVVGLDVSYGKVKGLECGVGVLVALEYPGLKPTKCFYTIKRICVPYIPGLLAFREMEVLAPLLAHGFDEVKIDLILVDGHGIAHPRGFGIASHLGVAFNKPSIGVAKRLLAGREDYREGKNYIIQNGKIVGIVLEKEGGKLYISPGHRVGVETSSKLVESLLRPGYKLPEPTRLADLIGKRLKAGIVEGKELEVKECTRSLLSTFI